MLSYGWNHGRDTRPFLKLGAVVPHMAVLAAVTAVLAIVSSGSYIVLVGTGAADLKPASVLLSVEIVSLIVLAGILLLLGMCRLPVFPAARVVLKRATVTVALSAIAMVGVMLASPSYLEGIAILILPCVVAATAVVRASVIQITSAAGHEPTAARSPKQRDQTEAVALPTVMQRLAHDIVNRTGAQACRLLTVSTDRGALVLRGEAIRGVPTAASRSDAPPRERMPVDQLPWLPRLLQRDSWLDVPSDIVATDGIGHELTHTLIPPGEHGDLSLRALHVAGSPIGVVCLVHPRGASPAARARQQRVSDAEISAAETAIERALRLRSLGIKAGWWSTAMSELPYGLAVVNRGTRLIALNPAAEAAVSTSAREVLGRRLCERSGSCICPLHLTLRTGESRQVPLSSIWPFPLAQAPAAGQAVNIWATTNSNNESELVVIALSATAGRDPAPRIGTEVAAMISHELRAPLATLRASSELALEELNDPERQRGLLSTISRQVDRLDHLVQDLADVFRLQAGKLQLNREVLDVPELCHELIEEWDDRGTQHHITVHADEPVRAVAADRLKIRTVLSNLVSNATKYAPQGTEVTISIVDTNDGLEVTVADNGPGIAQEDLPHVFDQFYRSQSAASMSKGYGLGLYITRSLVQLHGGHIRVENGPERGCQFSFVLPRHPDAVQATLHQAH